MPYTSERKGNPCLIVMFVKTLFDDPRLVKFVLLLCLLNLCLMTLVCLYLSVKTLFDDPRLVIFAGSWLVDGCSEDKQSERCVPRELH